MNGFSIILIFIYVLPATWIYYDSATKKIGRIPSDKRNAQAWEWAFMSWVAPIIVPVFYLLTRKKLIEKAKVHPIEVRNINIKALVIFSLGIGLILFTEYIEDSIRAEMNRKQDYIEEYAPHE